MRSVLEAHIGGAMKDVVVGVDTEAVLHSLVLTTQAERLSRAAFLVMLRRPHSSRCQVSNPSMVIPQCLRLFYFLFLIHGLCTVSLIDPAVCGSVRLLCEECGEAFGIPPCGWCVIFCPAQLCFQSQGLSAGEVCSTQNSALVADIICLHTTETNNPVCDPA
ncbi:hypothetical protein BaRGS_00021974 [Batillaria attramentaria]|uniref:Uncharacterized protein n=1 Tax=Batillaria attramentaria TaxID=370345 RepID=A0ABD0KIF3_9CAEN